MARVNAELKAAYPEQTWRSGCRRPSSTTTASASRLSNERALAQLNQWIEQTKAFEGTPMSADSQRALKLLKLMTSMPAPRDPQKLAELTTIAARMEGMWRRRQLLHRRGRCKKMPPTG